MKIEPLKQLEFELAYLAVLTQKGIKPLSRWEKPLPDEHQHLLKAFGLKTVKVERRVLSGKTVEELIFSNTQAYLDIYFQKFEGTSIQKSAEVQNFEGYLFGYPPCCVNKYIQKAYTKNDLQQKDQTLFFHWACNGCIITPQLLPLYKKVYAQCLSIYHSNDKTTTDAVRSSKPIKAGLAATVALTFLATNMAFFPTNAVTATEMDHQHHVKLSQDIDFDQDFLTNDEEKYLGTDPQNPDSDRDGVFDGEQAANEFLEKIDQLPTEKSAEEPFMLHFPMWGLKKCQVCGESVNRGFVRIVNPLENLSVEIPYMGLHFMEHGALSFDGSDNSARVQTGLLNVILNSKGGAHKITVNDDTDSDGLSDTEELKLGTDPDNSDTDANDIDDGTQLARQLIAKIDRLPRKKSETVNYAIDHMFRGFEKCNICGKTVNMGFVEIINPRENSAIKIPYIGLHHMKCGDFGYDGTFHTGRVNPVLLETILEKDAFPHLLPQNNDTDQDGLADRDEIYFNTKIDNPDSDQNGIPDGVQLAQKMWKEIEALPRTASKNSSYVIEYVMKGLETCEICNASINMGYVEIVNPLEDYKLEIPFIGLHYLKHGSFLYAGSVHTSGRINPRTLQFTYNIDGQRTGMD